MNYNKTIAQKLIEDFGRLLGCYSTRELRLRDVHVSIPCRADLMAIMMPKIYGDNDSDNDDDDDRDNAGGGCGVRTVTSDRLPT